MGLNANHSFIFHLLMYSINRCVPLCSCVYKATNLFRNLREGPRHIYGPSKPPMRRPRPQLPQGLDLILASEWDVLRVSWLQPSRTQTPSTPQCSICGPSGTPSGEKAAVLLLGSRKGARGRSVQEIAAQCWVITACVGTTHAWAVTRTTGSE